MADVNANVNILVNASQAHAELRRLTAEVNALNKSFVSTNSAAASQQAALNRALRDSLSVSGQFTTKIVPVTTAVDQFGMALEKNRLTLGQYTRYAASQLPGMSKVFRREFDTIGKLAESRVKTLQTQFINLGQSANGVQQALAATPTGLDKFSNSAAISIQKQQIFNKLLSDGSTQLLNWGKNTQWAGRQLMVGFTLPLTMLGAAASKVFRELESEAINFKKVYGDIFTTDLEVEKNLAAVKELSLELTKYGIAVKDTMALAGVAAQSGLRGADLMAATNEATRLAVLGQMEQAEAMKTVISMQTAFQQSNEELAESVDFLNIIENQTVLSLQDVAGAIPRVAPVIKGMGGDVKDLAVLLVAMREGGVSAAEGANALKNSLARLITPTSKAKDMAAEFGINLEGIVEKNKGEVLPTILDLSRALESLEGLDQQKLLSTIFGKFQYARMGALFKNISNDTSQAARAMDLMNMSVEDLAKTSKKELAVVEESTGAKFTAAIEQLKVAIAPIGEQFLKIVTPVAEAVSRILQAFDQLPGGIKSAVVAATAIIGGIAPVALMVVGLIANGIANMGKFILVIRKGLAILRGNGEAFKQNSNAQLQAAAAAATLEGNASRLTKNLMLQEAAVKTLTASLRTYAGAARAAATALPSTMGMPRGPMPVRRNSGGTIPGVGNKDTVPALLTPGEFVINKEQTQRNYGLIKAINEGKVVMRQGGGGVPDLSQSSWVFAHGEQYTDLGEKQSDALRKYYQGKGPVGSTAGNMKGYSNFGFILPELANQGKMSSKQLSSLFKNPKMMAKVMAPMYQQVARQLNVGVKTLMSDNSPAMRDARKQIQQYSTRIGEQVGKLGVSAVTDKQFYTAIEKASVKDLSEIRKAKTTMKQITTVDTDARGSRGQRVGISRAAQTAALGTAAPVASYKPNTFIKEMKRLPVALPTPTEKVARPTVRQTDAKPTALERSIRRNQEKVAKREAAAQRARDRQSAGGAGRGSGGGPRTPTPPPDDGGRGRRGMGGRAAMGASMALGMGAMIPMMKQDEEGKFMGMDAGTAMMGMIGASMLPGAMKGLAGAATAAAAALGVSVAAIALPVVAVAALAVGAYSLKKGFDNNIEAGRKLADAMTLNAKEQQSMADVFGTTTYAEKRRQKEISKMTGLTPESLEEGREFVKTEAGQSIVEEAKTGFEQRGKAFAQTLGTQLSQMVISGAISPTNAQAIAAGITEAVGKEEMTATVLAQINKILAPNGDDVTNSPLKIIGEIGTSMETDEASLKRAIGPKGPEDFSLGERLISGDYDEAARNAVAYGQTVTANTQSLISSYNDQIMVQDDLIKSLNNKISAEDDADKKEELIEQRKVAREAKKKLRLERDAKMEERRLKEIEAYAGRQEVIDAGRKSAEEKGIAQAGVMFGQERAAVVKTNQETGQREVTGYGGLMAKYLYEATGTKLSYEEADEFEVKWIVDVESGRIDAQALQFLQTAEEQQKGSTSNILKTVAKLQFEGEWSKANEISTLASQMDTEVRTVFNTAIEGPNGNDPNWVIEYANLLTQLPPDVQTEVVVALGELPLEELATFRKSLESLQDLGIDTAQLIKAGGVEAINAAVAGLEELETQLKKKSIQKGLDELLQMDEKNVKGRITKQVEIVTELTDKDGKQISPEAAKNAQDTLIRESGLDESKFANLPPDVAAKVIAMQVNADQYKALATAARTSAGLAASAGDGVLAAQFSKDAAMYDGIYSAFQAAAVMGAQTGGASMGMGAPPSGLPPVETPEEKPKGGGGGGGGKKEDPFKNMVDSIMSQIKMYADASAKLKTLFNQKNKFFKVLQSQKGIDDQIRRAGLEGTFLGEQIAGLDPAEAKKVLGKITGKGGRLNAQGRKIESAALLGSVAQRTSEAQASIASTRVQGTAVRELQKRGLGTADNLEAIAGDPDVAREYIGLIKEANKAEKAWIAAGSPARGKAYQEWKRAQKAVSEYVKEVAKAARLERAASAALNLEVETQRNVEGAAAVARVEAMPNVSDEVKDWVRENPQEFADLELDAAQKVADAKKNLDNARTKAQKKKYREEYQDALKYQNQLFSRIESFIKSQQTLDPGAQALEKIDKERESTLQEFDVIKAKFEIEFINLDQAFKPGIKASQKIIQGLEDQIDAVNSIIKGLQRQVDAQQRIIRGLERQKEMIQRRINAEERLNELDQRKADALSRQNEMIQRQIEKLDRQNELDQRRTQALSRQEEMLGRQTEQINRQIQAAERQNELDERVIEGMSRADEMRQRQAESINRELELMSRKEDDIREAYEERIKQLDKVERAQERINQQQQDQLDLAKALSTGDVYSAAAAAAQMRQNQMQASKEENRLALERSMEAQVSGLRTSGGLSRKQAEDQVEAIDDQSYQVQLAIRDIQDQIYNRTQALIPLRDQIYNIDLQIRDVADQRLVIEDQIYEREQQRIPFLDQIYNKELEIRDINDAIYERNLAMLPLKDQQYNIDLQIQGVNDVIYGLENQIYDIQKNRLEPLQDALESEQKILRTKERQLQEAKDNVRINGLTYEQLNEMIQSEAAIYEYAKAMIVQNTRNAQSVAGIANMWNEVSKRINQANKAARDAAATADILRKAEAANFDPARYPGLTPAEQAAAAAKDARGRYEQRLREIEATRQAEVNAARQSAIDFQNSTFFAGGKIKKYPMGGRIPYSYGGTVIGDGGRDSVKAMLTPGEFVIRKPMVDKYGLSMLNSINLGSFSVPRYKMAGIKEVKVSDSNNKTEVNAPVYNNYSVNVNVPNANIDANDVANKVITKIKSIEAKSVRGYRGF